jgi:hypothetical protein
MIHLAKLADFKADGEWSGTETDTRLLRYLADASSIAERLVGVPDGGLRRVVGRVEFPGLSHDRSRMLRLSARAIESVSEVVQLYATGTDADFDAAVANGDVLALNADYAIGSSQLASLVRINADWYRRQPRCIRVTTTAGLADPARIKVALATATWTEATKTLTQVGAFANYAFTPGDKSSIESGTGAAVGVYLVASRTSDDAIVLGESLSAAGVDLATGDIASLAASGATDPPDDLQSGVIRQAMLLRNTADTAGLEKVDFGDAGGSFTTRGMKTHPALVDAVRRYRRFL